MDEELRRRREAALDLGGVVRRDREHAAGRYTVRERIGLLLDPGSFREIGSLALTPMPGTDGQTDATLPSAFVCGMGTIDGRPVVVGGEDYTVQGGAVTTHLEKPKGSWTGYVEDLAYESYVPLVLLMQGGGGSVSAQSAKGYAYIVSAMPSIPIAELLARVPVAVAVLGPAAGSGPARTVSSHFSVISEPNGCMFAGGPRLVERSLSTQIDKFELGGADVHVRTAGNVDNAANSEEEIFAQVRRFLSYLPSSVAEMPPAEPARDPAFSGVALAELAGQVAAGDYAVRQLIAGIADEDSFFELGSEFGTSLVTGLARVAGRAVGILAHDSGVAGGAMDGLAADKQTRFVQLCDTFHLPVLFLVDTVGLAANQAAEVSGVLRRSVRALQAIHRASVPVLTLYIGKCQGLSGMATASPGTLPLRFAWPTARIADEAQARGGALDGGGASEADGVRDAGPDGSLWPTVAAFGIEEVIDPAETRETIAAWLDLRCHAIRPGAKHGQQFRP